MILSASDISLSFGGNEVLRGVSFGIEKGDRLAVVGVNGAGKTQLLNILCGELCASSGEVYVSKDVNLGYMRQNCTFEATDENNSIYEEMLLGFSHLISLEAEIEQVQLRLEDKTLSEAEHIRLAQNYDFLLERYKTLGGYEFRNRTRSTLSSLGFDENMQNMPMRNLSGGQKTRLFLARLLLCDKDILVLDEPTNHLDVSALEWLEDYLCSFRKTLIVVSHDRYFLDKVTNKTLDIEHGTAKLYNCAYSEYVERKRKAREEDEKHYKIQQREIDRLNDFIEQQRRWNREKNIIAAESRMKAIERMEKIEKPKDAPKNIAMKFEGGAASRYINNLLCIKALSKAYGQKTLFADLTFTLSGSDRLFILGENGVGKSTLLKILCGQILQDGGTFEYAKGLTVGYYDQEHQGLDEGKTVFQELSDANPTEKQSVLRGILARFRFGAEDISKPISVLSGDEKARVSFAKLMMKNIDILVLDEPTNHLDIPSREILEEALLEYGGTIIAVSHDRYFVRRIATRILELCGTHYFDFKGGYEDFFSYKEKKKQDVSASLQDVSVSDRKAEYEKSKTEKSEQRKRQKRLADAEREICELEKRSSEIDKELENTGADYLQTQKLFDEQNVINSRLDELYTILSDLM